MITGDQLITGFQGYCSSLINDIPHGLYEGMASVLCIGTVVLYTWRGMKAGRYVSWLLLFEYIILVYCSTVICRVTYAERRYNFTPFWSYDKPEFLVENIMNVAVFVPIGLLLGASINGLKWRNALLTGVCLSASIEILQFVFMIGFSEVDDVMHNTLGCMIGYGVYTIIEIILKMRYKHV